MGCDARPNVALPRPLSTTPDALATANASIQTHLLVLSHTAEASGAALAGGGGGETCCARSRLLCVVALALLRALVSDDAVQKEENV